MQYIGTIYLKKVIEIVNQSKDVSSQDNYINKNTNRSFIRSLSRIIIGGLLIGADSFRNRLDDWDRQIDGDPGRLDTPVGPTPSQNDIELSDGLEFIEIQSDQQLRSSRNDTQTDLIRYATIGMIFDMEERVLRGVRAADRMTRMFSRYTAPLFEPILKTRMLGPLRKQFNGLVDRGETEVENWIEIGRHEERQSRQLADVALYNTVDYWIDYFAENPEVVDLVTTQSVSFAGEIVEEIRERTVSADNLLEGFVRMIFQRPTRAELPAPPPEIQHEAEYSRKHF